MYRFYFTGIRSKYLGPIEVMLNYFLGVLTGLLSRPSAPSFDSRDNPPQSLPQRNEADWQPQIAPPYPIGSLAAISMPKPARPT
jgi:hypothetical protein